MSLNETIVFAIGTLTISIVYFMMYLGNEKNKKESLEKSRTDTREIVNNYIEILEQQKSRGQTIDPYGGIQDAGWNNSCKYFYEKYVPENLRQHVPLTHFYIIVDQEIENREVEAVDNPLQDKINVISSKNGIEYEHIVKEELQNLGWIVRHSGKSGDQGADLIASDGKYKVAIQCKFYTGLVGNRSVQEVVAAKAFYFANDAVVIASSNFTVAAQQLADANDVGLFHHNEIGIMSDIFSIKADRFNKCI